MKKLFLALMIILIIFTISSCKPDQTHNHTVTGELIVIKEATCVEEGTSCMFCTECGEIVNTITIPKTNEHVETVIPTLESTCTQKGYTEGKKCSQCGIIIVEQQETPLKAHTEEIIPEIESSCTKTGLSEGKKCSVCGEVLVAQQETPIVAHAYDDKYDESCNICGYVRDAECAHRETETLVGYEATCTSTGLTDGEKCKKCGEILVSQTVISVKEHTEIIDEAVEPTCTTTGLTEGKHCGVCNAILTAQTIIYKLGHECSDWEIIKDNTTIEDGLMEGYCSRCCETVIEIIPKYDAHVEAQGLEYALNPDGQSYSVIGIGTWNANYMIIPSMHEGLPVTIISDNAFKDSFYNMGVEITHVEIPDTVTKIGDFAFSYCRKLGVVYIPNSVTSIGNYAFEYTVIKRITFQTP